MFILQTTCLCSELHDVETGGVVDVDGRFREFSKSISNAREIIITI